MTKLRALVFNTLFYALMLSYMVFGMFMLIIPRRFALVVIQDFMHRQLALQRLFGMKIEVRGGEHFPVKGGIIASKHQSIWETFALHSMVPDAVFIYKKELGELPLFGNYLRKFEQIEVNRKGGPLAAQSMTRAARQAIELGRQILIFPEGTRRPPGSCAKRSARRRDGAPIRALPRANTSWRIRRRTSAPGRDRWLRWCR